MYNRVNFAETNRRRGKLKYSARDYLGERRTEGAKIDSTITKISTRILQMNLEVFYIRLGCYRCVMYYYCMTAKCKTLDSF
jgi:hypothetical protein